MRLRFQILSPNNTGAPDYTICNQAASNIDLTDLNLTVKVDGTDIINTIDLSSVSFPLANVTTANGIIVSNIDLLDTYFIEMEIGLQEVYNDTTLEVSASKTGYLAYQNVFEIYGYDLGNNPNQNNTQGNPIDYNPNMDIYLINEIDNVVNGKQTKAFAAHTAYRRPYTDRIYYYTLSSSQGTVYYQDALGTTHNGRNGFFCKEDTCSVRQVNEIYGYVSCARVLLDTCISSYIQADALIMKPEFNVSVSCQSACPTDCDSTIESEHNATTYLDFSVLSLFWKDDVLGYPYTDQYITYQVLDYTGTEVLYQEFNFSISYPTFVYNPQSYELVGFQLPEKGDYVLSVNTGVVDTWGCYNNTEIKNCHWYEIEHTDCSNYKVYNRAFEDITLEVSQLNANKEFEVISTQVIPSLGVVNINHSSDGIYQYKVTRDDVSYIYLVFNYCNMQTCILKDINSILCPTNDCGCSNKNDKCELYYDFNTKIINAVTYFNMLNSEYNFNFLYESLSPSKLDELYDIKTVLDRFEEYCETKCDCGCS